jgi:predicted ATPase
MMIESLTIKNFKMFRTAETFSLKNRSLDEICDRLLVLGDNGSGKTTLLQAIALPLALATRKISRIEEFDWVGFIPTLYGRDGFPEIAMDVVFTAEELEATQAIAERWFNTQPRSFQNDTRFRLPGKQKRVQLALEDTYWKVDGGPEVKHQFHGRYYAKGLLKYDPKERDSFAQLPGVFWFDQQRNLGGSHAEEENQVSYRAGVERLRNYLVKWDRAGGWLRDLEDSYKTLFPNRRFKGAREIIDPENPLAQNQFFMINDGVHDYELAEMSSGEQSLFPILYDFVRQKIAYSIVLIDEVELNLHPPLAQAFVSTLHQLAPHCQFILTTHSESVNNIIGEAETLRLMGGALCL